MPKRSTLKHNQQKKSSVLKFAINVGAVFLFVTIVYHTKNESPSARHPSSLSKAEILESGSVTAGFIKHTRKLTTGIHTNILNINSTDFTSGEAVELKATVVSQQSLPRLNLNWVIPDDVDIIDGDLSYSLENVKGGKLYEFFLTVKSDSEENQTIHLRAASQLGKIQISNNAQYNTINQSTIQEGQKRLSESNRSYIKK